MPFFVSLNRSQEKTNALWHQSQLMILFGDSGTGKTFAALAMALLENPKKTIWFSRPQIGCDGEEMGHMPGDLSAKFDPWLAPFRDAFEAMHFQMKWEELMRSSERVPLRFLRGRTVRDATLLIDEAQNMTYEQIVCAVTRVGMSGRVILMGDPAQSDRFRAQDSPLIAFAAQVAGVEGVAAVDYRNEKVVRSDFVGRIVDAIKAKQATENK